jgi:hypothetical protein
MYPFFSPLVYIPALKVNIIIVYLRGVVFPEGKTTSQG